MYRMSLIFKTITISHAEFQCNRLTTVQDIQDYASLIFLEHGVCVVLLKTISHNYVYMLICNCSHNVCAKWPRPE